VRGGRSLALIALLAGASSLTLAACGGSSRTSGKSSSASATGSQSSAPSASTTIGAAVTLLYGTAPQSLDPGSDESTQGAEINWLVDTGLITYAHAAGVAGTRLIPGLATTLPVVSDGGKTYTVTLRRGLVFSNGQPVTAGDFAYTVERALKIPWPGAREFIASRIQGASAFANGEAGSISGLTADDATGKIVIRLTAPYAAFDYVLALPALGIIPAGTPLKAQPSDPPPGVGPYKLTNIVPNVSFTAVPNPYWAQMAIPGIPAGHVSVEARIDPDGHDDAVAVLDNSADLFDWADAIPRSLLARVRSQASGRFRFADLGRTTAYIFLSTYSKPFDSQLAREAVVTALNHDVIARLGSGALIPACSFLPPAITGHATNAACPHGVPYAGSLARAIALVRRSGLQGYPVTVSSEAGTPVRQWMTYYTRLLSSIGFRAVLKVIPDVTYAATIGNPALRPPTGYAQRTMDFPDPTGFYVAPDGGSIAKAGRVNLGEVNDPYLNAALAKLGSTSAVDLPSIASQSRSIDRYIANMAYVAVLGYRTVPEFTSDRIDYAAIVMQPEYGWDWTSFALR